MKVTVWNIRDWIAEYDESFITELLAAFSCVHGRNEDTVSLNPDIEHFIKANAIQFARQKIAVSYIVGDEDDGAILGYFTIAHKPIEIPERGLSKSATRTMSRYAAFDNARRCYLLSCFLLAQFGKNYAVDDGKRITGHELMTLALNELAGIQHRVGGGVVYLDCEDNTALIRFYEDEGFRLFGERTSQNDNKRYLQFIKFI